MSSWGYDTVKQEQARQQITANVTKGLRLHPASTVCASHKHSLINNLNSSKDVIQSKKYVAFVDLSWRQLIIIDFSFKDTLTRCCFTNQLSVVDVVVKNQNRPLVQCAWMTAEQHPACSRKQPIRILKYYWLVCYPIMSVDCDFWGRQPSLGLKFERRYQMDGALLVVEGHIICSMSVFSYSWETVATPNRPERTVCSAKLQWRMT